MNPNDGAYNCSHTPAPRVSSRLVADKTPRFESMVLFGAQMFPGGLSERLERLYAEGWSIAAGTEKMLFLERPLLPA